MFAAIRIQMKNLQFCVCGRGCFLFVEIDLFADIRGAFWYIVKFNATITLYG